MKTNDLIDLLARAEAPVDRQVLPFRFAVAFMLGAAGALLVFAMRLNLNPGLVDLLTVPAFWVKTGFTSLTFIATVLAAARLARPGVPLGNALLWAAAPTLVIWVLMTIALAQADAANRVPLMLGATWRTCPLNIALLSLPIFAASLWALRGLAPTRLRAAGAVAGFGAGALGAVIYGLHCPELASPFLGVWYVLGMATPALLGTWLGPRLLRW